MKKTGTNFIKRILVFLLCLSFLLPLIPTSVSASSTIVGTINGTFYTDIGKLWKAMKNKNGDVVIHMDDDWNLSDCLEIPAKKKVTIHMHGHMINRGKVNSGKPKYASDSMGGGTAFLMQNYSSLTLIGEDSPSEGSTSHMGNRISDAAIWYSTKNGGVPIYGALITGSATDSAYGAITVRSGCTLTMSNVTMAGNVSDSYLGSNGKGSAIMVQHWPSGSYAVKEPSKVNLTDCELMYNYSENAGGAIAVCDTTDSTLNLKNCYLGSNVTEGSGGAIYLGKGVKNTTVNLNNSKIISNRAEDGGGIYIYSTDNTIDGGKISYNNASGDGGGIYVREEDNTLSNITITNNKATKDGSGVVVSNHNYIYTPVLKLSGKVVIKDNRNNVGTSDLYLQGSINSFGSNPAYIQPLSLSADSEIWVHALEDRRITYHPGAFNELLFHSSVSGRYVTWVDDYNDSNYRHLMYGTTAPQDHKKNKEYLDPAEISQGQGGIQPTEFVYKATHSDVGCNGIYDVYKGYGLSCSMGDNFEAGAYYYSDGYFLDNPFNYNEHLSTLSLRLAMSAFRSMITTDTHNNKLGYTYQFHNVKQMLSDIGCDDDSTYIYDQYLLRPGTDTIGFAIGMKTLYTASGEDSGYVLVPIAVRGANYDSEWAGNVTLGSNSKAEHAGFSAAAEQVLVGVEQYLDDHNLREKISQGKVRFWIVGFSRAGATSNLAAKELIDRYQPQNNAVYGYHFEAPQGGVACKLNADSNYNSIHNVINAGDIVPQVAMVTMNFQRYGVDHFVPGSPAGTPETYYKRYAGMMSNDSLKDLEGKSSSAVFTKDNDIWYTRSAEYNAQRVLMKDQLAASSENIPFDDYFHLATFTVKGAFSSAGYVQEVGKSGLHIEDWEQDLLYYLLKWMGLNRYTYVSTNTQKAARDALAALMTDNVHLGNLTSKLSANWLSALGSFLKDAITFKPDRVIVENLVDNLGILDDDCIPISKKDVMPVLDLLTNLLDGDLTELKNYPNAKKTLLGRDSIRNYGADSEYLVQFATIVNNIYTIGLNHYPEVCYAWLRSYDDYYLLDSEVRSNLYFIDPADDDQVDMPYLTYKKNGVEYTMTDGEEVVYSSADEITDIRLHLTDRNSGGAIYYIIDTENGKTSEFYQQGTNMTIPKSHIISAYSMWYSAPSQTANFIFKQDTTDYTVYVNGAPMLCSKGGRNVNIVLPQKEYNDLVGVEWDSVHQPELNLNGSFSGTNYTFTMPYANVYLEAKYKTKQVKAPVANVKSGTYIYDQPVTFSTPSGTEEDGFYVNYTCTTTYSDGSEELISGNYSTILLDSYDNSVVTWKVKATAYHEGWLDSEPSFFTYTIDPSKREYFVITEECTLPGGVNCALYHPGDTVTITYQVPEDCYHDGWNIEPANLAYQENGSLRQLTFTMPYDDVTVEAIFEGYNSYPITVEHGTAYDMDGQVITGKVNPGNLIHIVADAPKKDSEKKQIERFYGWTGTGIPDGEMYDETEAVFRVPTDGSLNETEGVRLTAHFDKLYKVGSDNATLFDRGGAPVDRAAIGDVLTAEIDVPEGYILDYWEFSTDVEHTDSSYVTEFVMPASELTVNAVLKKQPATLYAIDVENAFVYNQNGILVNRAAAGEVLTVKPEIADGYVLDYWEFSPNVEHTDSSFETKFVMPASEITIRPVLRYQPATLYEINTENAVVYNQYGLPVDCAAAGDVLTVKADVPEGYVFDYWEFSPDVEHTGSGIETEFVMPGSALTVTAVLKKEEQSYPITIVRGTAYDMNGQVIASKDVTDGKVHPGDLVRIVADEPRVDSKGNKIEQFIGWTGTGISMGEEYSKTEVIIRVPTDGSLNEIDGIRLTAKFELLNEQTDIPAACESSNNMLLILLMIMSLGTIVCVLNRGFKKLS